MFFYGPTDGCSILSSIYCKTVFAAQNAWLHIHDAIDETPQQSLKQISAKVSNDRPKYAPWYVYR